MPRFTPRVVLLLDGAGAALTALLLILVLAPRERFFGLPRGVAVSLALFGGLFASFSLVSALCSIVDRRPYLRAIAFANFGYCVLSIGLAAYYGEVLTLYGKLYLAVEVLVITVLATVELVVARGDAQLPR